MENELLQVLSALNQVNVHGEADCQKMIFAISKVKALIVAIQRPQETTEKDEEANTDGE